MAEGTIVGGYLTTREEKRRTKLRADESKTKHMRNYVRMLRHGTSIK